MTGAQIAIALIALVALAWFGFKLWVAFDSDGGAPVLDGALLPPALGWFAACQVDARLGWPGWNGWLYLIAWLFTTALAWWLIGQAAATGERRRRRRDPPAPV